MDSATILLLLFLACLLVLFSVVGILYFTFPPAKPIVLAVEKREQIVRAWRDRTPN